jgi:hypothetical protein
VGYPGPVISADLSPEWLLLVPLALALGIELYLTLLVLVVLAYLPMVGLPGGMAGLASPWIAAVVLILYVAGWKIEEHRDRFLVWELFHLPVRFVAGGLMAFLLMPPPAGFLSWDVVPWTAIFLAAGLATGVQFLRIGWSLVVTRALDLPPGRGTRILAEDLVAVGLLLTTFLWAPLAGVVVSLALLLFLLWWAGPFYRAARFAPRLLGARIRSLVGASEWTPFPHLPSWIRRRVEGGDLPHQGVRGVRAALVGVPDTGILRDGWFVLGPSGPLFLYRTPGQVWEVALFRGQPYGARAHEELLRVDWRDQDGRYALLLPRGAPETEFRKVGLGHLGPWTPREVGL